MFTISGRLADDWFFKEGLFFNCKYRLPEIEFNINSKNLEMYAYTSGSKLERINKEEEAVNFKLLIYSPEINCIIYLNFIIFILPVLHD